MMQMAL